MNNISKFTDFLSGKGYRLIQQNEKFKIETYEKDGLFIRVTEDRNRERFIELSCNNEHSWEGRYDMDIVRFIILKSRYEIDESMGFNELSTFFIDHYDEILEVFEPSIFFKTEQAFENLKKERAKALFGI